MQYHCALKFDELIDYRDDSINSKVISKNGDFLALLVAIKKHQLMHEHISPVNAFIYLLEGEVEFRINSVQIKTYSVKKGEIFTFASDEKHSVYALKDTKMLVVRI